MSESALLWLYGSSALIAMVVLVATLRSPGLASFRAGLVIYLTGTAWWALVDVWRWVVGESSLQAVEAWTLPAGALVIGGVRVGVYAATRAGWRPTPLDIIGFAAHPALTLIVAATPPLWQHVARANSDGSLSYGPLFWAHVAVTYALLVAATIDLFRGSASRQVLTRKSLPIVACIWAVPLVASAVTVMSEGPNGVDLMPPGFALTSLLVWKTLVPADIRYSVRFARSQVLEELADAVIVLGEHDQILDANAAALALVGAEAQVGEFVDKPLRTVWPEIADAATRQGEHDLTLDQVGSIIVDVTISHLSEAKGSPRGRAVVIRDVTDAVRQRRELADLRSELADLVVRDPVTGLHNRRYAEQTLPKTLARCVAKRVPFSIAAIDVDHFKAVNDNHGHPVGDRVLRALAKVMLEEVPSSMVARMGGEEFLVMLPGLSRDLAFAHTERLRNACARAVTITRAGEVSITVSAGVATTSESMSTVEALMEAADAAMYRAKREGRNRTCVAGPPGVETREAS